jgi:hypothetical protein
MKPKRTPYKVYLMSVGTKCRQYWYFVEDAKYDLEGVAQDLVKRNAKAGREFSYEISGNDCNWRLYYPSINRTTTGYIRQNVNNQRINDNV